LRIKTAGHAYMVVTDAPEPLPGYAAAAAEMALGMLESLVGAEWSRRVAEGEGPDAGAVPARLLGNAFEELTAR
jgi:hypothetical protein